jgi:hypothetical protein
MEDDDLRRTLEVLAVASQRVVLDLDRVLMDKLTSAVTDSYSGFADFETTRHLGGLKVTSMLEGRAMAQVVSRRPLTAEARVRVPVNPCGICGGQSGTGTGFSPSSSVFPCQYIIPPSLSKLISGECVIC